MDSVHDECAGVEPITGLCRFRDGFYSCLGARADAQFELTEALLCADGPVRSLVDLSLAPEHRRGHGALYDGLNHGSIEIGRLRRGVAGLPLPRVGDRIVLAADVSPWLRPDAETSPARLFCHVHGRAKGTAQMIPGWPYSVVAALGTGRSSWTAVLDAARLGPTDDATAVTAAQLRQTVDRLREAGHGWLIELWRVCARSQGCRGTRPRRAGWSSSAGAFWGCGAASGRHDPGWPAPGRSSCASRTGRLSSRCWQAALIAANGYKGGTSVVTGLIAVPAPVASVVVRHDLHHVSVDDSAGVREAL